MDKWKNRLWLVVAYLNTASKRWGLITAARGSQNMVGFRSPWFPTWGENKNQPQSPIQGDGWWVHRNQVNWWSLPRNHQLPVLRLPSRVWGAQWLNPHGRPTNGNVLPVLNTFPSVKVPAKRLTYSSGWSMAATNAWWNVIVTRRTKDSRCNQDVNLIIVVGNQLAVVCWSNRTHTNNTFQILGPIRRSNESNFVNIASLSFIFCLRWIIAWLMFCWSLEMHRNRSLHVVYGGKVWLCGFVVLQNCEIFRAVCYCSGGGSRFERIKKL